jgi:protein-tyrosine phosphatase
LSNQKNISVLFVCMGNICRSPTAQGVFERLVADNKLAAVIQIDSAGTHAYHIGEKPDERASAAALKRGVDLTTQKARRVGPDDFHVFDYVIAMDSSNFEDLASSARPGTNRNFACLWTLQLTSRRLKCRILTMEARPDLSACSI